MLVLVALRVLQVRDDTWVHVSSRGWLTTDTLLWGQSERNIAT